MTIPRIAPSFDDVEASVRDQATKEFAQETALANESIEIIWEAVRLCDRRKLRHRWEELHFSLTSSAFNSIRLALELLARGYAIQSLALTRAAYEAFLTAAYVFKHRREARFWMAKKYAAQLNDRRVPSFAHMVNDLHPGRWPDIYGLMSVYAHPRVAGLLATRELGSDGVTYRFGAFFDARHMSVAFYCLLPTAHDLIALPGSLIASTNPEWAARAEAFQSKVIAWLTDYNSKALVGLATKRNRRTT